MGERGRQASLVAEGLARAGEVGVAAERALHLCYSYSALRSKSLPRATMADDIAASPVLPDTRIMRTVRRLVDAMTLRLPDGRAIRSDPVFHEMMSLHDTCIPMPEHADYLSYLADMPSVRIANALLAALPAALLDDVCGRCVQANHARNDPLTAELATICRQCAEIITDTWAILEAAGIRCGIRCIRTSSAI